MCGTVANDPETLSPSDAVGGRPSAGTTWMWEVRAAQGRVDDLVAWVADAVAGLDHQAEVYRSRGQAADRVVAIVALPGRSPESGSPLPEVPADLVARPPQAWVFDRVR